MAKACRSALVKRRLLSSSIPEHLHDPSHQPASIFLKTFYTTACGPYFAFSRSSDPSRAVAGRRRIVQNCQCALCATVCHAPAQPTPSITAYRADQRRRRSRQSLKHTIWLAAHYTPQAPEPFAPNSRGGRGRSATAAMGGSSHCSRAGKRNVSRHLPPYARFDALGAQPGGTHRAAASALSSGRVLKAMGAAGADLRTVLTTASNSTRCRGGRRTPAPITTQS